mmetsp:Transcript_1011/g.1375  ORF Transcript_1011/g.1375 Transcript_1011/m.1375 type:complete len:144 (-) Transcript_1011:238-669(-)|eukprot:CAMPEP_0201698108 /NCGR_PEP_ID=MMETSP0578-20130828/17224_1 /ASSEMBLY_ACC=CAM_ASM_000663 /TAXON_ID=267565 /ORGANISM="Skeletonema grethea, Strain CCMP 1804" /LENGTH=143 /DNA_ID=CAMNT_0048184549 /DNA_START=111 /DNA_END=542 /DNA_ORIENTATION=-
MSNKSSINRTDSDNISITRTHFTNKGYRVHSGLQFGCELVLYADDPSRVHSDFCVHVVPPDGSLDWRMIQTLTRLVVSTGKTLIVANVKEVTEDITEGKEVDMIVMYGDPPRRYVVEELAIATEHAPFRHKNVMKGVGLQTKH